MAFGVPWPEASQLTLSFVPDGTIVGNRTSVLFKTLNAQSPTAQWELESTRIPDLGRRVEHQYRRGRRWRATLSARSA